MKLYEFSAQQFFGSFEDFFKQSLKINAIEKQNATGHKREKNKAQYNILDGFRVMDDAIVHVENGHQLSTEQWHIVLNLLNNGNINRHAEGKKSKFCGKPIIYELQKDNHLYGLLVEWFPKALPIVVTAFEGTKNGINDWFAKNEKYKQKRVRQDEAHSLRYRIGMLPERDSINSITDKLQKVNPLTENLTTWFKGSKAVDVNGNPLVVYHGTNKKFNSFRYNLHKTGADYGKAFYFTTNKDKASAYAYSIEDDKEIAEIEQRQKELREQIIKLADEEKWDEIEPLKQIYKELSDKKWELSQKGNAEKTNAYVLACYLNIQNPLEVDAQEEYYYKVYPDYFKQAKANNNDGIIIHNVIDNPRGKEIPMDVYIVFDPKQIKSINAKEFANNDNIYENLNIELHSLLENNDIDYDWLEAKMYALNKKAKEYRSLGGHPEHDKLYKLKNKLIQKFGTPTGKIHSFKRGYGREYTINGKGSFHDYSYSLQDLISNDNSKIIREVVKQLPKQFSEVISANYSVRLNIEFKDGYIQLPTADNLEKYTILPKEKSLYELADNRIDNLSQDSILYSLKDYYNEIFFESVVNKYIDDYKYRIILSTPSKAFSYLKQTLKEDIKQTYLKDYEKLKSIYESILNSPNKIKEEIKLECAYYKPYNKTLQNQIVSLEKTAVNFLPKIEEFLTSKGFAQPKNVVIDGYLGTISAENARNVELTEDDILELERLVEDFIIDKLNPKESFSNKIGITRMKKYKDINEAGYNWNAGMSNNAVSAYENGEKPLSKWKKSDIITELQKVHTNIEKKFLDKLKKLSISGLKNVCLTQSSWHHTSKFYNKTDFYSVDNDLTEIKERYDEFIESINENKLLEIVNQLGKGDFWVILDLPREIKNGNCKNISQLGFNKINKKLDYFDKEERSVLPQIPLVDIYEQVKEMFNLNEEVNDLDEIKEHYKEYIESNKQVIENKLLKLDCISVKDYYKQENKNATILNRQIKEFNEQYRTNCTPTEGDIIFCKYQDEVVSLLNFLEQPKGQNYFIYFVIIRNDFQGKDLFKRMLEYLIDLAKKNKIKQISSVVDKNNISSIKAHRKIKFNEFPLENKDKIGFIYKLEYNDTLNECNHKYEQVKRMFNIKKSIKEDTNLTILDRFPYIENDINSLYYSENSKNNKAKIKQFFSLKFPNIENIYTIEIKQSNQSASTYIELTYCSYPVTKKVKEKIDNCEIELFSYTIRISDHEPTSSEWGSELYLYFSDSDSWQWKIDNYLKDAILKDIEYYKIDESVEETPNKMADLNTDFWKWFNGSKIVDEKGNPLICYHGTPNAGFEEFHAGSHFTKNKEYADIYQNQGASSIQYKKTANNPQTYAVYLSIKNPFDTREEKARNIFYTEYTPYYSPELSSKGLVDWLEVEDLMEWLQENHPEYDGIYADEGGVGGYGDKIWDRGVSIIPFKANQIKSIYNKGNWSSSNNIYETLNKEIERYL